MKVGTRVRVVQTQGNGLQNGPSIGAIGKILRIFPDHFLVQFDEESKDMHHGKLLTPEFYNGKSDKWYCRPETIEEISE